MSFESCFKIRQASSARARLSPLSFGTLPPCPPPFRLCPRQVRNFSNLSGLGGLSAGTILLATLGNALCIPRALAARDAAWALGATWGCIGMGWLQLLCLALGRSPETGCARGRGRGGSGGAGAGPP